MGRRVYGQSFGQYLSVPDLIKLISPRAWRRSRRPLRLKISCLYLRKLIRLLTAKNARNIRKVRGEPAVRLHRNNLEHAAGVVDYVEFSRSILAEGTEVVAAGKQ